MQLTHVHPIIKPPLRLPCLNSIPTSNTVSQLVQTLAQNPERTVTLQWLLPDDSKAFMLTLANVPDGNGGSQVQWSLYSGLVASGPTLWSQFTNDQALILERLLDQVDPSLRKRMSVSPEPQRTQDFGKNTLELPLPESLRTGQERTLTPSGVSLSGELSEIDLTSVLQSIALCKMTGQLSIIDQLKTAAVNFEDGALVHATFQENSLKDSEPTIQGDPVILELLTWQTGSFNFTSNMKTAARTVKRRMEGLLMEGIALRDYCKALLEAGFHMEMVLVPTKEFTDQEFEETLRDGLPLDKATMKSVFELIKQGNNMGAILKKIPMAKTVWIPIVFNFHNSKVIEFTSAESKKPTSSSPSTIDAAAARAAFKELCRPETGLFSHKVFLYFVLQEYSRYQMTQVPFSVAVMGIKSGGREILSNTEIRQISTHIENNLNEDLVVIAHYQDRDFAVLLPCVDSSGAKAVMDRLVWLLRQPIEGMPPGTQLEISYGLASLPEHCQSPDFLLSMAGRIKAHSPR